MNTSVSSTTLAAGQQAAYGSKALWGVVGVLSVAVLGLGGVLVSMKSQPTGNALANPAPVAAQAVAAAPLAVAAPVLEQKPAVAGVESRPVAPKTVAKPVVAKSAPAPVAAAPVYAPVAAPVPVVVGGGVSQPVVVAAATPPVAQPAPRIVCASCGTIESVTPVQKQGHAGAGGAIAGGVVGAVLGNQVGNGNGKTLATILGGVAGGVAGHAIEKNMKKETVYSVRVQMEDGSSRTLEQATAPAVGAKVTVDGNVLRSPDGAVLSGPPQVAQPRPAQPRNDGVTGG